MDIIAAYHEAGTYRGAAQIAGTTHKTVRRVIARQEAGGAAPARARRGRTYDGVAALVAERVKKTLGRISAKWLLPAARAAGYQGSDRNFRRLVAEQKAAWRREHCPSVLTTFRLASNPSGWFGEPGTPRGFSADRVRRQCVLAG